MLKDEINLMLTSLMNNKKAFKKFYKKGYISYSKDRPFEGGVAIVEEEAIMSYIQYVGDDSNVIATATFKNGTTFIYQVTKGTKRFSVRYIGMPEKMSSSSELIISGINSVRSYCEQAEERLTSSKLNLIKRIFSKTSHSSDRKLSKQDVRFLLETTLDKLKETRNLHNRDKVSPRVQTASFATTNNNPDIHIPIDDKTPEI